MPKRLNTKYNNTETLESIGFGFCETETCDIDDAPVLAYMKKHKGGPKDADAESDGAEDFSTLMDMEEVCEKKHTGGPKDADAKSDGAKSKLGQAADTDDEQEQLRHALENAGDSYKSLVQHASTIYNALGIASLTQFVHVTESDVAQVNVPAMQKHALIALARAHDVGTKLFT